MHRLLLILLVLFIGIPASAQPGQYNTKSKKAIKYFNSALEATRQINQTTGQPDYETALQYLDKAIAKDPNFTDAYDLKADFCMRIGDTKRAIQSFRELIAIEGFSTSTGYVYFYLASMEWSEAMYADALEHALIYQKNIRIRQKKWLLKMIG